MGDQKLGQLALAARRSVLVSPVEVHQLTDNRGVCGGITSNNLRRETVAIAQGYSDTLCSSDDVVIGQDVDRKAGTSGSPPSPTQHLEK